MSAFIFESTKEDNDKFLSEINFLKSLNDKRYSRELNFSYGLLSLKIIVKKLEPKKESARVFFKLQIKKSEESLEINFSLNDLFSFLSLDELVNNALLYFKENHNLQYKYFIDRINNF